MIRNLSDFRWTEPIKIDSTRRDQNRRYSYHKDHNHTTEQCNSLHYLERLIKVRHLKQYVNTTSGQRETAQELVVQAPASSTALKVVINYIDGGPVDDIHSSKWQRQRLLHAASVRERVNSVQCNFSEGNVRSIDDTITFPPIGANRVLQTHENALILTLGVSGFDVRRVLVNPGGLVDLLQMLAYKQMSYSPFALENLGRLLSGFNGAMTTSLGDVVLLVQAGPITLNVQFSVVDNLSSYNANMGRAWLHKMKVIPSTYHRMVSYHMEEGQVDLLGSQLVARQCYQVALDSKHPNGKEARPKSSNTRDQ